MIKKVSRPFTFNMADVQGIFGDENVSITKEIQYYHYETVNDIIDSFGEKFLVDLVNTRMIKIAEEQAIQKFREENR